MSLNGSGVYNVNSAGQPVVANTLITAAAFNAFTADIATALSTAVFKDGQQTMTANLPMSGFKITGLGAATATGDAIAQNRQVGGLLDLSGAAAGQVKFPATQNASADANTLDDYREGSFTATLTGCTTAPTYTVKYTKIGNEVKLTVSQGVTITGTSNAITKTLTGMPAALFPASTVAFFNTGWGTDSGGAATASAVNISSAGVVGLFFGITGSAWTNTGAFSFSELHLSYTTA